MFAVRCQFDYRGPVTVENSTAALYLYRIAQEAVTNAVRHGKAGEIRLSLSAKDGNCTLRIENDGLGLPDDGGLRPGLGISIMKYRARKIRGDLAFERLDTRGSAVVCTLPCLQETEQP